MDYDNKVPMIENYEPAEGRIKGVNSGGKECDI